MAKTTQETGDAAARGAAPDSGLRIVCIGGGTGLYTILSGLKERYPQADLAAVVTMMDSGGSTGRLRDEFGYLPPGDVRQCLVALSEAPLAMRKLMQHRFHPTDHATAHAGTPPGDSGLSGHVVGNILLTAFKDLSGGDEYAAIESMERLLRIRGKVYPVTVDDCHIVARLEDGQTVKGEMNIDVPKHDPRLRITSLSLEPPASLFAPTRAAIEDADHIVIGPGDLYTSVMPNLIVEGLVDALKRAKERGASIIFVTNTMTKHGETNGFSASDFVRAVQERLDGAAIDAVIANAGTITAEQARAYAAEHAIPVLCDLEDSPAMRVVIDDLVADGEFARHDPHKLASAVGKAILALRDDGRKGQAEASAGDVE